MKRKIKDTNIIKIFFGLAITLLLLVALIVISSANDNYTISEQTGEKLYYLPNGVIDTEEWQNVSEEYSLQASDILIYQTRTNVDIARLAYTNIPNIMTGTGSINGRLIVEGINKEVEYGNIDLVTSEYGFYHGGTYIELIFPKGTYANREEARTALTGTKIIYQLETPIEKPNLQTRIAKHQSSSIIKGIANGIKNIALAISKTITDFFYLNDEITTRGYIFTTLLVATMAISIIGLIIKR